MDNEQKTESTEEVEVKENNTPDVETPDKNNEDETGAKKYTDEDVNKIVQQKLDREKEKRQHEVDEAEKLAKMNAKEKQQYEVEKIQKEADDARAKLATYEMRDTASNMLSEQGISSTSEALDLVATSTADGTKSNVGKLIKFIQTIKDETTKELTKGSTPRTTGQGSTLTKEDIMKIADPQERQQKIAENIQLFSGFNN